MSDAPVATTAALPATTPAHKHKRPISKVEGAPSGRPPVVGGITFTAAKAKVRRIAPESAPRDTRMADATTEPTQAEIAAEKAREEKAERRRKFLEKHGAPLQSEANHGTIRFIKQSHLRFTPSHKWFKHAETSDHLMEELFECEENGKSWAWAQIYGEPSPTMDHLRLVEDAFRRIAVLGTVEDFKAEDYVLCLGRKAPGKYFPSMAILCNDDQARKRLNHVGAFSFHTEKDEIGVFVQPAKSNGTGMILDLENAPPDATQMLEGCYRIFKDVILWSKVNPDKLEPVEFKYGRVTRTVPKGSKEDPKTETWRIAFKIDSKKLEGWTYPKSAGIHGARGEVSIEEPPFCKECISYSHDRKHCEWWREKTLTSRNAKPKDFVPMTWTNHKSFLNESIKLKAHEADQGEKQKAVSS